MAWMLPRIVGLPNALDLLFSARQINAAEALRMGLVNQVFAQENFLAKVNEYAVDLASRVSPRSLRVIKRQVYGAMFQTLAESFDLAGRGNGSKFAQRRFQGGRGPLPGEARPCL